MHQQSLYWNYKPCFYVCLWSSNTSKSVIYLQSVMHRCTQLLVTGKAIFARIKEARVTHSLYDFNMAEVGVFDRIVNFFVVNEDPRTKPWLLSNSPGPLFIILVTYLYFCLYAGPQYMKNRKPFELKNTLVVYNAIQVLLSIILVVEGLEGGWRKYYNFRCQPVDYSYDPVSMRMARAVWLYYICKISELLDTVFFVLRKKQNQVSFLHVYHHTLMPFCGFIGIKYFAGGHGTLLGLINSFIHTIMYMYYMLAAMGPQIQKHLWWKKYLTVMQIVQFLIIFIHTIQIQFQSDCNFPKFIAMLLTINAGLFTYMFTAFYIKSYKRDARARAIKEKEMLMMDEIVDKYNYINSKNLNETIKRKGILLINEELTNNQHNCVPLNGYHSANQYYESPIMSGFQLDIKKDI